jgi:lysophospholipase L1-like esterase
MGDSYSAGNGAGEYSGAAGCYRSARNYAQDFAVTLRSRPYSQPTSVTNVACSGAVTADFTHSKDGRPPELSAVNTSYNLVFLTIGGNDVDFSDVVKYCLIAKTRDGANCNPLLANAENLIQNGTMRTRITNVLKAVYGRTGPETKIVLLGYPFLEGDTGYTLRSGHGDNAPIIKVGQRLHAIGVAADALDESIVGALNDTYSESGSPFVFVSVQKLFDGPPYHGLYAQKNNPNRWMVQPFVDASLATDKTWYHPNPTGWSQEAGLLAATASIPKHPIVEGDE